MEEIPKIIEWEYIYLTGHYGYWVVKNNKNKFEKEVMESNGKVRFLKQGENPNIKYETI